MSRQLWVVALLRGLLSWLLHRLYSSARASSLLWKLMRLLPKQGAPGNLPHMDTIEKVFPNVYRILGHNPGYHTLQGTNIYLLVGARNKEAILIDAGEGWSSSLVVPVLMELLASLEVKRVRAILLTHGHADHQGGVVAFQSAIRQAGMEQAVVYKRNVLGGSHPAAGFLCEDIREGQVFSLDEEPFIEALYTPGHTDDHVAFLLCKERAVFTGDCVLGCGTSVFDNLAEYMRSLRILHKVVQSRDLVSILPGHGPVLRGNAVQKVEEYLHHRDSREKSLMEVLVSIRDRWVSSLELVSLVYGALPTGVVLSAQANLLHHLHKLLQEGRVRHAFPDLWRWKN